MLTVAYLANQFPSPLEPYVFEEIAELRRRGLAVIPCSVRRVNAAERGGELRLLISETLYLEPSQFGLLVHTAWLCVWKFWLLRDLFRRVMLRGGERPARRFRALLHTFLGVYYALILDGCGVDHIHVHHGYFASWVAMVAARLLHIPFSLTLHGSDLLLHSSYLDIKLKNCEFCVTISKFNRNFILDHYPEVEAAKIQVRRMGVIPPNGVGSVSSTESAPTPLIMLAVGRLHPVKNHAFLLRGCYQLKSRGLNFVCLLAGEGPERSWIEHVIRNLRLEEQVKLLGHLSRYQLDACYANADLVVLTSRSEGIPLVLMEAMARARIVLAPAITGIPELVQHGQTGYLYHPGSLDDFVAKIEEIRNSQSASLRLRLAARQHVLQHFDREKNLAALADLLVSRITTNARIASHENPVLQ